MVLFFKLRKDTMFVKIKFLPRKNFHVRVLLGDCWDLNHKWKYLSGWNSSSIQEFRQVEKYYSNHQSTIQLMLRWQVLLNGLKRRKSIQTPTISNICLWTFVKNWKDSAQFSCQFHFGKWLRVFAKLEFYPLQLIKISPVVMQTF